MTDLRKLSNHPLLMRYHYDELQVREMAQLLAKDVTYKDTVVDYIVHDLLVMSDFEINKLTKFHRVSDDNLLFHAKFGISGFDMALFSLTACFKACLIVVFGKVHVARQLDFDVGKVLLFG